MTNLEDLSVAPSDQLAAVFASIHAARSDHDDRAASLRQVTMDELVGGDQPWLTAEFQRLTASGFPPKMAATYLVGWYASSLAELVGLGLASSAAAIEIAPASARWRVHALGWAVGVEADFTVTVAADHPWACHPDVTVVASELHVAALAARGLAEAVRPIVEACRALTRVGAAGLWNEVGDALGLVLIYQSQLDTTDERVALLERAVATRGVPWRALPKLWFIDGGDVGRLHVGQKGGCCLAYTEPGAVADAEGSLYCSTCSLRDADACAAKQVQWRIQQSNRD